MGSKPPYCSICMLFHTYQQVICTTADSSHYHSSTAPTCRPHIVETMLALAAHCSPASLFIITRSFKKGPYSEYGISCCWCCKLVVSVCFACCQTECANSIDSPVMVPGGRMRTKPLIPEMCFTTTTEEDSECEQQPVTPHLEEDGTSLLISCSHCSVRVHTSQYTDT